jgi:hypothetical protein
MTFAKKMKFNKQAITRVSVAVSIALCIGWWFGKENLLNNVGYVTTGGKEREYNVKLEERKKHDVVIKIPEYDALNNAKGIGDLPPRFTAVFAEGRIEQLSDILYADGMPDELRQWLLEGITPASKDFGFLHSVVENWRESFNAGEFNGKRIRFLIYPTHFLCLTRFDRPGPPSEVQVGLALTADGIKVVGYKFAEGAEPISDDQPGIGPHMPRRK